MLADGALRQAERIVSQIMRLLTGVLRLLFRKLWSEPAEIRGSLWTARLWILVAAVFYVIAVVVQTAAWAVIVLVAAWFVLGQLQRLKPKGTYRPLPHRRHRRR